MYDSAGESKESSHGGYADWQRDGSLMRLAQGIAEYGRKEWISRELFQRFVVEYLWMMYYGAAIHPSEPI